jgi:uncharacterized integral membrane protein
MSDGEVRRERPRIGGKEIAVIVLLVVILALCVANFDDVEVDFVFASVDLPLVLVIVISGLIGLAIGWLVGRRRAD